VISIRRLELYTILNSRRAPPGAGSILDAPSTIGDLGDQQRRCVNRTTMAELCPLGRRQPAPAARRRITASFGLQHPQFVGEADSLMEEAVRTLGPSCDQNAVGASHRSCSDCIICIGAGRTRLPPASGYSLGAEHPILRGRGFFLICLILILDLSAPRNFLFRF
jgi:hypothetical protein